MEVEYSKWGMLQSMGITEEMLQSIVLGQANPLADISSHDCSAYTELKHGLVMELYYFAESVSKQYNRNPNRVLKLLMDSLFPMCTISRADRLGRRIKGFCTSYSSLSADKKASYLQKSWQPQPTGPQKGLTSTKEMRKYGLCEKELEMILRNPYSVAGWHLQRPASKKFYVDLHNLLCKRRVPAKEIEMIEKQICSNIEVEGCTNPACSDLEETDVSSNSVDTSSTSSNVIETDDGRYKKHNVKRREQRAHTKVNQLQVSCKSLNSANQRQAKKIQQLSDAVSEYTKLLHEKNVEIKKLKQTIHCLEDSVDFLESEVMCLRKKLDQSVSNAESTVEDLTKQIEELQKKYELQTFSSRSFNCNVRELYYALLTMNVPPARIKPIIENVLSCLFPSVNLENVRFPKKSCAAYMRSEEMPTISSMHKGSVLSKSKEWHLNSDGTTLHQSKKVAFLINGIVLGVHDVNNGTSEAAIDTLKAELKKIDSVNPDDISRIVSSTSDGASTQSKFNKLLQQTMPAKSGTQIVENKCAMHLGVNLRHAHVKAMSTTITASQQDDNTNDTEAEADSDIEAEEGSSSSDDDESQTASRRQHNDVDVFIHEICKMFGHLGTPEYCHGASTFREFLAGKIDCVTAAEQYYVEANNVHLERQVGSRYYVTSCNAGRIYFLKRALIEFLQEQSYIKPLNLLELACLKKLTSNRELIMKAHLEGLLFDRVYADLMMLVKSRVLKKTALDMTVHYEELLDWLQKCVHNPALFLDRKQAVFKTEEKLYSSDKNLNHRLKKNYQAVHKMLYSESECADYASQFSSLISQVCVAMCEKLRNYWEDYLPGGRYHNADVNTQVVLSQLKPHNDQTESVFGSNDWLDRILPNMAQATRSAMIEFTYNKTLEWLKNQGEEQKRCLIKLAQQRRKLVSEQAKQDIHQVRNNRVLHRAKLVEKGRKKAEKIQLAIEALKDEAVIVTSEILQEKREAIFALSLPDKIKEAETKYLIRQQVAIRSKVYNQKVRISLTEKGKPKTIDTLFKELSRIIKTHPIESPKEIEGRQHQQLHLVFNTPSLLVGCKIKHQFEDHQDGKSTLLWYHGKIIAYKKQHFRVSYPETDEICDFTLSELQEDFNSGDFWFI